MPLPPVPSHSRQADQSRAIKHASAGLRRTLPRQGRCLQPDLPPHTHRHHLAEVANGNLQASATISPALAQTPPQQQLALKLSTSRPGCAMTSPSYHGPGAPLPTSQPRCSTPPARSVRTTLACSALPNAHTLPGKHGGGDPKVHVFRHPDHQRDGVLVSGPVRDFVTAASNLDCQTRS